MSRHNPDADTERVRGTVALLNELARTAEYNARKLGRLSQQLGEHEHPTLADLLEYRGHALAQAGYVDAAIHDLSSLLSDPARATPDNRNKLAQQLIYRAKGTDVDEAIRIASNVAGDVAASPEQRFFANDLLAQALLVAGRKPEAIAAADAALALHDSPRVHAIRALAEQDGANREKFGAVLLELGYPVEPERKLLPRQLLMRYEVG